MNWELSEVKDIIRKTVQQFTKAAVDNDDRHLLCSEYGFVVVDFLYVFRELEDKLQCPVAKVLENHDYTVFTVNNLSKAILEDCLNVHQSPDLV